MRTRAAATLIDVLTFYQAFAGSRSSPFCAAVAPGLVERRGLAQAQPVVVQRVGHLNADTRYIAIKFGVPAGLERDRRKCSLGTSPRRGRPGFRAIARGRGQDAAQERVGHAAGIHRGRLGAGALQMAKVVQDHVEALALHELHGVVMQAVGFSRPVNRNDVRMLQRRDEAGLVEEALAASPETGLLALHRRPARLHLRIVHALEHGELPRAALAGADVPL